MVREAAAELFQSDRYIYRKIYNLPRGSPLVDDLSDLEIAVELEAHRRYTLALSGKENQETIESDPVVEEAIAALEAGAEWESMIPEELRDFFSNDGSLDMEKLFENKDEDPPGDAA